MSETPLTAVEHLPNAVLVRLMAGHLGKTEVDGLCAAIDQARAAAPALSFILDMVNVNFASSLTMGVLVGLTKEFQNRGQRLIFVRVQPNLQQAFAITHLNRVFEIMADVAAAQESLAAGA
jgi:anti-anti-sigma factor